MVKRLSGRRLARGEAVRGVILDGLVLDDCGTVLGPPDELRPVIEQCEITRLRLRRSFLIGAVVRDVTVNGIRGDMDSRFFIANEFERVKITGDVGVLVIGAASSYQPLKESYRNALTSIDASSPEWSLDIAEARGAVDIRGYAADRVRIDPETQAVVRRADLTDGRWRALVEGTLFTVQIDHALDMGWSDLILVADRSTHRFDADMAALGRLRAEGIIK
ncbi:hypothetical protein FHS07_003029 [Microbacterium proteolyticum]|uniref:Uncharacterized protein n=1 Tax=Microbacterium proteolyticum TaxID=1572644 RepID=A0A7W5GGP4_9MICO|nr:hypothetical protein [Microbacterium proteolyticum]MBB3159311.1 hypothetical protein [Microbacterium proteolyticum]